MFLFSTQRKFSGENSSLLKVHAAHSSSYHTGTLVQIEYPARQSGSVGHARCHTKAAQRDGRKYGPGSVALARFDYLLLRAGDWTTSYCRYDTNTGYRSLPGRRTVVVTNVLGVRRQRAWCNRYDSRQMRTAVAAVCLLLLLLLLLQLRLKTYVQQRECRGWRAIYENKTMWDFPCHLLGSARRNPLFFRAISAAFNTPSTATLLDRDPDMRSNVPTAPSLAPRPKVRERTIGRRRAARL